MSDLSDRERDARQAAQALASLTAFVRLHGDGRDAALRALAAEGVDAAERVLAYLRELHRADGEPGGYPARLAPWRDWYEAPGQVLDEPLVAESPDGTAAPRWRGDPGE
jgi:hypothetical protein